MEKATRLGRNDVASVDFNAFNDRKARSSIPNGREHDRLVSMVDKVKGQEQLVTCSASG